MSCSSSQETERDSPQETFSPTATQCPGVPAFRAQFYAGFTANQPQLVLTPSRVSNAPTHLCLLLQEHHCSLVPFQTQNMHCSLAEHQAGLVFTASCHLCHNTTLKSPTGTMPTMTLQLHSPKLHSALWQPAAVKTCWDHSLSTISWHNDNLVFALTSTPKTGGVSNIPVRKAVICVCTHALRKLYKAVLYA